MSRTPEQFPYCVRISNSRGDYEFWIDEYKREVRGTKYLYDNVKKRAKVRCSEDDNFDPLIGISLCMFRLDLKTSPMLVANSISSEEEIYTTSKNWREIKDIVKRQHKIPTWTNGSDFHYTEFLENLEG